MTSHCKPGVVMLGFGILFLLGAGFGVTHGTEALIYPVYLLDRVPTLDGEVEGDQAWEGIPRARGFRVLGGVRKVGKQTSFRMGFTEKALYVGVVCEEPAIGDVQDMGYDGDANICRDNTVEVFVRPAQSDKVFQVIVNTLGAHTDYVNDASGEWHDVAPEPLSRAAGFKGGNFYSVEIEIPFGKLEREPRDGEIWRGNVCRNRTVDGQTAADRYATWARLVRRFLEPENFAQLVFHRSGSAGADAVIDSGEADKDDAGLHLVVDLRFDEGQGETAHGQSAIINDGKIIGATWTPRGSGYCLEFEKEGDRVEIPNSESLSGIKDAMTLECWAYFDLERLRGTRGTLISSTPSSGFSAGFYLDYVDEGTQTRSICFGLAGGSSSYRNWVYAESVIETSGWHHVLATYDPKLSDEWRTKIYVDGQRRFLRPEPRNKEVIHRASGLPLFIGAKPASREAVSQMTATFLGCIDEVRVWDTALAPEDIERLYGSLWAKSTLLSPGPSEAATDGKPRFEWTASEDGTGYVFEMAKAPDFSGGVIVKEGMTDSHYQLSEALSPGCYYWRVWSTDKAGKITAACPPRAFVVPFKLSFEVEDTTPPTITDVKPPLDTTSGGVRPEISARWSD
ncbi:MAG: LamG-like jellyroll fold domain-containing protein, partial [Planctomycetota bacterium]